MRIRSPLPACLLAIATAAQAAPPQAPGNPARRPTPVPPPPAVSPGTEAEARGVLAPPGDPSSAESSARELQPGAGEVYLPPPPIPPVPPGMFAVEGADAEAAARLPLTLEQVEKLAVQYNPTLIEARAQVETAFGTAIQAGLWPNPTLSYFGMSIGLAGTIGMYQGGFASQMIPTAGRKRLNRARFLETTKAGQWEAMAVEYRVLNDVRIHYFRTLGMQAIVEIQKELVQNAEDFVVTIQESYNLGLANRREMHEANAALQAARLSYLDAQNGYRQHWQHLMAVIGVQMPFTPLAGGLEGDTTPIEYDAALSRILEFSPNVQEAYANLRARQIGLKFERVQPWPNLMVVGGAGYHAPSNRAIATSALHLSTVPIWNWNQGNIRAANAQVVNQEAEIRRVSLELQYTMAMVYETYLTSLQHVENYQKVVLPELRRAYELTLDSYEDDRNTWGDVLMAQRLYYMNRMAYVTQLMSWRQSEVMIVGFLLHGGLMAPPPAGASTPLGGAGAAVSGQMSGPPAAAVGPPPG